MSLTFVCNLARLQEDVEQFLSEGATVETALGAFNELYSKYKYMETSFERSKNVYKSKIPEIEQTLELIKLMIKKEEEEEEMITNYNLCDTIYAAAKVASSLLNKFYRQLLTPMSRNL